MTRKKNKNPDLTAEFRIEQENAKKAKKNQVSGDRGYSQYPPSGDNSGYPYYQGSNTSYPQYGYPSQKNESSFHQPEENMVSPSPDKKEGTTEELIDEQPTNKRHKKSRVKEYGQHGEVVANVEKQYHTQQKRRYFIRGALILLNFVLLIYVCYSVVDLVLDLKSHSADNIDSYITLQGKSKDESRDIYHSLLNDKQAEKVNDYAVYGDDIYFSGVRISLDKPSSYSDFYVANACAENRIWQNVNPINLSSMDNGDYVITTSIGQDKLPIKYTGKNSLHTTVYSLPDVNGLRTKTTIRNNSISPVLVLSKQTVSDLPENYYDFVFYVDDQSKDLVPTLEGYTSKIIDYEKGYSEVYTVNASYAIDLTGSAYISSSLSNYDGFIVDNDNSFIKEIGGYLTGANSCTDSSTCVLNSVYKEEHIGKKSFVFDASDTSENILTHLKTIV